ncbi:MAG: hypothetical protein WDZ26_01620 [Nitriliruptoraceae bacterium]
MNGSVRSVLVGLVTGLVTLLLLDLARILEGSNARDGDTSIWWSIACYVAVGVVVAVLCSAGLRDRLAVAVAAMVVLLFLLPALPVRVAEWVPSLPLVPVDDVQRVVALVAFAAFSTTAARGGRRR